MKEKWTEFKNKVSGAELSRSWQYLLYIYVVLPAVLFLFAWLLRGNSMGHALASLYHTYNIFVVCPIPNFQSFTGVLGLLLAIYFLIQPIWRKNWFDLAISGALVLLNFLFFYLQTPDGINLNYVLLRFLSFQ